jgi:hypothetical protein
MILDKIYGIYRLADYHLLLLFIMYFFVKYIFMDLLIGIRSSLLYA